MQNLKAYVLNNFEQIFVAIILGTVILIGYYFPNKMAFLNFYYIPVLAAGYIVGKRFAILGGFLCFFMVIVYGLYYPLDFTIEGNVLNVTSSILIWGCFLVLVGILVGTMHENSKRQFEESSTLNTKLRQQKEELAIANARLKDYSETLEERVKSRTEELEQTNRMIEKLNEKMQNTLYSTMDSEVAQQIIKGRLRNEKRQISILFSDLTDFTAYSDERRPEVVIGELNRFLEEMEPIVLRYHGHIDKYLGDGIMCEFGAPTDYPTHSLQAVLAGIKMQERLAQLHFPWKMRIGIGTGFAITGLIGKQRQAYTAIGDIVNLASRLQGACPPGKILIDEETYRGVERFVEAVKVRSVKAKKTEVLEFAKRLEDYRELLRTDPENVETLFKIGNAHAKMGEMTEALQYYEKILSLDPNNVEAKLAYAEASVNRDKYEKVEIRGKKTRISVYEVLGIKDTIMDSNKIPEELYRKYKSVEDLLMNIPEDVILPVETLDGRIGHARVVTLLSYAIADRLGVPEKEKHDILTAAYLSDIEMGSVSHHLLNRAGRLNDAELKEVEKHVHPVEATRILKSLGYHSDSILDIVLHHHEMFNGKGYPFGKRGEEIPLGARIVAVADTYDALTSWRPYREGWERHAALAEIQRGAERGEFDPQVVHTLMELLN